MNNLRSFVRHNSMIIFVICSYLFSWWPITLIGGMLPHGPLLAALLVIWLAQGKEGLKSWWGQVTQRHVAPYWYAIAALIPPLLALSAAALNIALGAQRPAEIDWTIPFQVLPVMLLVSGMWEEPGWTAYALPRLYAHFGPSASATLKATLVMAMIRTGWHLPLMMIGAIYWSDIVAIIAFQIVIAWLYNASAPKSTVQWATGGSVLAVMLLHLLNNTVSGEFIQFWFAGADWARNYLLMAALWSLLAIGLLFTTRMTIGRKPTVQAQSVQTTQPTLAS